MIKDDLAWLYAQIGLLELEILALKAHPPPSDTCRLKACSVYRPTVENFTKELNVAKALLQELTADWKRLEEPKGADEPVELRDMKRLICRTMHHGNRAWLHDMLEELECELHELEGRVAMPSDTPRMIETFGEYPPTLETRKTEVAAAQSLLQKLTSEIQSIEESKNVWPFRPLVWPPDGTGSLFSSRTGPVPSGSSVCSSTGSVPAGTDPVPDDRAQ